MTSWPSARRAASPQSRERPGARARMLTPRLGLRAAVVPSTSRLSRAATSIRSPSRARGVVVPTLATSGGGEVPDRPAPLIRRRAGTSTMERLRVWTGVPGEGAVERLSVICAHCNAKLTPSQMDYACVEDRLVPDLRAAFRPLRRDDATNAFLMRSSNRPWAVNWAQAVACTYLRKFMSLTDANAILGRGKMHVLSREQAEDLLADAPRAAGGVLLDVGAGEGEVTEKFRDGGKCRAVVATEASAPMVRRLRQKRFDCVVEACDVGGVRAAAEAAGVDANPEGFDVIALLNVLDRCDEPFTLLAQLRSMLRKDGGRLVLAVVLPFRPFVEDGNEHRPPRERLPLASSGAWETGANQLYERVLRPSGFKVERLARVPYISEGDQRNGAYILDDAVFVLSASDEVVAGDAGTGTGMEPPADEPRDDANAVDAF